MKKTKRQHKNISKAGKHFDMDFAKIANDMENRLKKMGIKIPHSGPRIPDPAHTRGEDVRTTSSSGWQSKRGR
ncbi:MAG: hypothetical protein F4084_07085 [Rhodothermaceae bacterium]|nr:hypothetical protein [Rhodothermaceae bacterium]